MVVVWNSALIWLGYTPLQAGVRVLPAAGMLAVTAAASTNLLRAIGTKLTVALGLLVIAFGLWQLSRATVDSTYGDTVLGMVLLGVGAGLVMPTVTESVMGTLPRGQTGVGAATNGVSVQVGGALGVAVVGSLLSTRYQDLMRPRLAPFHLAHSMNDTILGSLGGALRVAAHVPGPLGTGLGDAARSSFMSGLGLGLGTGAVVVSVAAVLTVAALPARPPAEKAEREPAAVG